MSKTEQVLDLAVKDAKNAQWPGLIGKLVLHPVRDKLVVPGLEVAKGVVSWSKPVTDKIPLVDDVYALALNVASNVVKTSYTILPHEPDLREVALQEARKDFLNNLKLASEKADMPENELITQALNFEPSTLPQPLAFGVDTFRTAKNGLLAAVGFSVNSLVDLIAAHDDQYAGWKMVLEEIQSFLVSTGVQEELLKAFYGPRVITNIRILSQAQREYDAISNRRTRAMDISLHVPDSLMKEGKHYLKYATAAYGISMFGAQEPAPFDERTIEGKKTSMVASQEVEEALELEKKKIADGLGIKVEDIRYMTAIGGRSDMLRHFVAVDHEHKAVVLAIRGTFTLSDVITDVNAKAKPYLFNNLAHSGFVDLAEAIWNNEKTRNSIEDALNEFDGYEIILTGHSLGAGVASLLNIRFHVEYAFKGWKIRCFGYANPPALALAPDVPSHLQAPVLHALKNSYSFQFGIDTVPFLSVDSVRRLLELLNKMDDVAKDDIFKRWKIAYGLDPPTLDILEKVRQPVILEKSSDGTERLDIAANFVIWTRRTESGFDYAACDPHLMSALNIHVEKGMLRDHFPDRYADSLEKY